ncbi:MAG: SagB/ThcOx family dehydrogenase [Geothrix sp.]|nr:SagB/ThcOx family dehydrogenase [Geothrix sp.]
MRLLRPSLACFAALLLGAQAPAPLKLPGAPSEGASLNTALRGRATARALVGPAPTLAEAGQLLWAAQGENRPGKRVAPSAHAKHPLELYLITSGSADLGPGLYHYLPPGHQLTRMADGTPATLLGAIKGMQAWIQEAPAVFVMAGDPSRIGDGALALHLTYYEGGAAAQGLLLQASALGLGAGTAAGVDLEAVARTLKLPKGTRVLTLLPVGHAKP